MAENREEVLSQLYALRGSISYMSGAVQNMLAIEKRQQAVLTSKSNKAVLRSEAEIDSYFEDQKNMVRSAEKNLEVVRQKNKKVKGKECLSAIMTVLGIIMVIVFIVLIVKYDLKNSFPLILIGLPMAVICGVWFFLKFIEAKCIQMDLNSAIKSVRNAKEQLADYEYKRSQMIEALDEYEKAKEKLAIIYDNKESLLDELRPIYDATIATYSDMIDERDWEYLDVVIYYFETKRADSIKEALQLVDRMVQTNMIISAVETASKDIQNCIYNACRVLAGTITAACNKICAGLGAVVSAVDMQNALYEQSNRTSSQMAADIKYIKEKTDKISKNRN